MVKIDGKTMTCGLLGNPVEHTMSPAIHNTLAELQGHSLVYVPFLVDHGKLGQAVAGARALHIKGLNVTVPYKTEVMQYVKELDPLAQQIGAANTLVETEEGYKGYNTDMQGLYRAMVSEGIRIEEEKVIVLGAGGAARAVCFLLAFHKAKQVYLLNRTVDKAQKIAEEVNGFLGKELVVPMALQGYDRLPDEKMLAIQATSVGLAPHDDEVVIDEPAFYEKVHTGYDLIYRPLETKFMKCVKAAGGAAYHGLKMLLYQGIIAYELWNHVFVSEEQAEVVYEAMKEAMGI